MPYNNKDCFFTRVLLSNATDTEIAEKIDSYVRQQIITDISYLNNHGDNALHICVRKNYNLTLKKLLDIIKSNVFYPFNPSVFQKNVSGKTPFHQAIYFKNIESAKILIESGLLGNIEKLNIETHSNELFDHDSIIASFSMNSILKNIKQEKLLDKFKLCEKYYEENKHLVDYNEIIIIENFDQIYNIYNKNIDYLCQTLMVDRAIAETLTCKYSYNLQAIINDFNKGSLMECNGSASDTMSNLCIVCYSPMIEGRNFKIKLPCKHATCDTCWKNIILTKMDGGNILNVTCPHYGCDIHPPISDISLIVPKDSLSLSIYDTLSLNYIIVHPAMKECPREGCKRIAYIRAYDERMVKLDCQSEHPLLIECPCGLNYCFNCKNDAHEPLYCKQYNALKKRIKTKDTINNIKSKRWITSNAKACPLCQSPIYKYEGCSYMRCSICGHSFCYRCGRSWVLGSNHDYCFQPKSLIVPFYTKLTSCIHQSTVAPKLICNRKITYNYCLPEKWTNGLIYMQQISNFLELKNENGDESDNLSEWLDRAKSIIMKARLILQNSLMIERMNPRNSTKLKYFLHFKDILWKNVTQLEAVISRFPGYFEVPIQNNSRSSNVLSIKNLNNYVLIEAQFKYCYAMNHSLVELNKLGMDTLTSCNDLITASRLGIFAYKIESLTSH